jgi:hypothetical protein
MFCVKFPKFKLFQCFFLLQCWFSLNEAMYLVTEGLLKQAYLLVIVLLYCNSNMNFIMILLFSIYRKKNFFLGSV